MPPCAKAQVDDVNAYIEAQKPWELAKQEGPLAAAQLHAVCSASIEAFRLLTLYLKPVLPEVASSVEAFLRVAPLTFADTATGLGAGHTISAYQHLLARVDSKQLDALFATSD